MLLLPVFYLSGLVTAIPTSGPWSGTRIFSFDTEQHPFHLVPEIVKDSPFEGFALGEAHKGEETIWKFISNDPRFTKLTKAINFADAAPYFDNKNDKLTFFATPDSALPHSLHGCDRYELSQIDEMAENDVVPFGLALNCRWDDVMSAAEEVGASFSLEDDKRKRREKFFKLLIRAILAYQTLPETTNVRSLGYNTTHATKLAIPGVLDGQPLRVRIEQRLLPPSTTVNFYAKVVHPDVKASNGIIHVMNHPILPPLTAFQNLFLIPQHFSFLTSAIQRVGLTNSIDLRHGRHGEGFEGTSSLTLFAPVNLAFERLPLKLRLFLFSPLGHSTLRKLLEFHIVPGLVVHSDYQFNKSAHIAPDHAERGWNRYPSRGDVISNLHLQLPTLLDNRTIHTHIKRTTVSLPVPGPKKPTTIKTEFSVNHRHVLVRDAVSSNGAIHVLGHLLDPRRPHGRDGGYKKWTDTGDDTTWEDWEEWLPQWANSN